VAGRGRGRSTLAPAWPFFSSIAPSFCQRLACILDTPRSGRNVTLRDISSEVSRGANRAPSHSRVSPRCGHVSAKLFPAPRPARFFYLPTYSPLK